MFSVNCNKLKTVSRLQLWKTQFLCKVDKALLEFGCMIHGCQYLAKNAKLEHVGILHESSPGGDYEIGQTFLHRVFAYRGVILASWTAQMYIRSHILPSTQNRDNVSKQSLPKMETYYQVLVDSRDSSHIPAKCEITHLRNHGNESQPLETICDMDYVAHSDIIPYTSVEPTPIYHDMFDKFLIRSQDQSLCGTEELSKWQEENRMWLELTNVHVETTDDVRVTAIPFFLGMKSLSRSMVYWWRYCIRIENLGKSSVQLWKRYWRIISNGTVRREPGRGVIGREPILNNQNPAFQYSSQVPLWTPTGHMWGTYRFEREDGEQFDVRIPAFALESKLPDSTRH